MDRVLQVLGPAIAVTLFGMITWYIRSDTGRIDEPAAQEGRACVIGQDVLGGSLLAESGIIAGTAS